VTFNNAALLGARVVELYGTGAATGQRYNLTVNNVSDAVSRGEWSAAKPSCAKLQNAWVSDRTLCYLASGKPVVVQHTGPSAILPDASGMHRFATLGQAVAALERVQADYAEQCRLARALAEEHFAAERVVPRVLDRAFG
jgi:hypothetical protein